MREITRDITVFVGMPKTGSAWIDICREVDRACANPTFTGTGSYDGIEEPYIAMDSRDFLYMLDTQGRSENPNFYAHLKTQGCVGIVYIDDFGRVRMGTRPVPFVLRQVKPDPADKEVCSMPYFPASAYQHIKGWIGYGNHIYYPAGS